MLTELRLQNYRCFRDVTLRLSPLTILVGPNAGGKSSLLRALDGSFVPRREDFWMHQPGTMLIGLNSGPDQGRQIDNGYIYRRTSLSCTFQCLQVDIERVRHPNQAQRAYLLAKNGYNLANVFATLTRRQQQALSKQLCDLVPMFQDVGSVPTDHGGQIQLCFQDRWNEKVWYPPSEVSDGTMLLTAFLTLQYGEHPPDIIAIEEPERGLHPYLVGELIGFLRKLSRGEIGGKAIQVILATHSADLLDHVQPEEVRFLSRDNANGSVNVEEAPVNDPGWRETFRNYHDSLGAAWLAGGLGGVPGT